LNDPDRYAVAAVPAISTRFKLNSRMSSRFATKYFLTANRPETIRQKARFAWSGNTRGKNRNLWRERRWLEGIANLIRVALDFESMEYSQHVTRVLKIAELRKEKRFAREVLIPLIDRLASESRSRSVS
jgi:hypothetical protein